MTAAVLTTSWDDGTPSDVKVGRMLTKHGFRGTFYATTGPGGRRAVSDDGLRELASLGHELANHGRSHRPFPQLTTSELLAEIAWGEDELRPFTDPPHIVAPPRGLVSRVVVETLNAHGYLVRTAPIIGHRRQMGGLIVPSAQFYPHTLLRTYRHLVKQRAVPLLAFLKCWSTSRTTCARFQNMLRAAQSRELALHVWGHGNDLERFNLWHDLELFLDEAANLGFSGATNGELAGVGCAS